MPKIVDCTQYVRRFRDYYERNPAWGIFHVSLADGNPGSWHADPQDDEEWNLAAIFVQLSDTQRRKIARLVSDYRETVE